VWEEQEKQWIVEPFRPEDAEGISNLYRMIYGEHFPKKEVYLPDWIRSESACGNSFLVVARDLDGQVISSSSLFRSVPTNPDLYEAGGAMVLDAYKQTSVGMEVMNFLIHELPKLSGIKVVWGEAVCNHIFTQMMVFKSGHYPSALEVDMMPASSYEKLGERGQSENSRVSTLVVTRQIEESPMMKIYLPSDSNKPLREIYGMIPYSRSLETVSSIEPVDEQTDVHVESWAFAGLCRISVTKIGKDFPGWFSEIEKCQLEQGIQVLQVILPSESQSIAYGTDFLRKNGYWLGGVMPCWFGNDGLLMQKTVNPPDFEHIHLYSKPAKKIVELVKGDFTGK